MALYRWRGTILKRELYGGIANSVACCCGEPTIWGVCIQLNVGSVGDAILGSPPEPPMPQNITMLGSAFIQYAIYSYNDGPGSSYKEYQSYSWLIQFCNAGPNGQASDPDAYLAELNSWANDPASIGWTSPEGEARGYFDCQGQSTLDFSGLTCGFDTAVPEANSRCETYIDDSRPLCTE